MSARPVLLTGLLAAWLLPAICLVGMRGRVVPPGNVWEWTDYAAVLATLCGACHVGVYVRHRVILLLFGCVAGLCYVPLLLPDRRDYMSIALGSEDITSYLFRTIGFVTGMMLACYLSGALTAGIAARRMRSAAQGRCPTCGYLLMGLPEPRCPECGTSVILEPPSISRTRV